MDGLTVLRAFRAKGYRPPFILMTAFGDREIHVEASRLGAVAVVDKPFDFDALRHTVRSFASSRSFA
jgi:two-component system response regulator FixJ